MREGRLPCPPKSPTDDLLFTHTKYNDSAFVYRTQRTCLTLWKVNSYYSITGWIYHITFLVLFQGSNVMEDQDLLEIGILNSGHRQRILQAIQLLPKVWDASLDSLISSF